MLLPSQYAWFEPVLIASIVVFIIDLIGNSITFSNRYLSALVSAICSPSCLADSSTSGTATYRCQRHRRQVPPRLRKSSLQLLLVRTVTHSSLGAEIVRATT